MRSNFVMTFWNSSEDKILGFILKGRKYYSAFIGDVIEQPKRIYRTPFLEKAREKIETYVRKMKVAYTIRASVDEYFNGDHCSLRFEHFDANGECFKKYYETDYSTNKYFYYTTSTGKDILMIERI